MHNFKWNTIKLFSYVIEPVQKSIRVNSAIIVQILKIVLSKTNRIANQFIYFDIKINVSGGQEYDKIV